MKYKPIKKQVCKPNSILNSLTKTNNTQDKTNGKSVLSINMGNDYNDELTELELSQKNKTNAELDNPKGAEIKTLSRKELLEREIISFIENDKPSKPKKNQNSDQINKTVVLESVNKLRNNEYVLTETPPQENHKIYLYDQYNSIIDTNINVIGVYHNKKVYLIDSD